MLAKNSTFSRVFSFCTFSIFLNIGIICYTFIKIKMHSNNTFIKIKTYSSNTFIKIICITILTEFKGALTEQFIMQS